MNGTMRVFISVEVPEEIREKAARLAEELPKDAVRPVKPENMHLTLRFVGEIPKDAVDRVKKKLGEVKFSPFVAKFRGVGVFPSENYVRVVWVGVESEELLSLASEVKNAMKGEKGDERFSAHLTIARVKRKIDARGFLEKHRNDEFGEFEIKSFELMQSKLQPGKPPEYTIIASFPAVE